MRRADALESGERRVGKAGESEVGFSLMGSIGRGGTWPACRAGQQGRPARSER